MLDSCFEEGPLSADLLCAVVIFGGTVLLFFLLKCIRNQFSSLYSFIKVIP